MGDRLEAVTDTGPVIHLDQIDSLYFLNVFDNLVIPEAVIEELSMVEIPEGLENVDYVRQNAENTGNLDLDPGEAAALNVAVDRDMVLLTDDMEARKKGRELGVETHGSIGIIAMNQQKGNIDVEEAERLMYAIQEESSLYTTDYLIERAVEKLRDAG